MYNIFMTTNEIILLNIEFYNNLMKIILIYIETVECDKNAGKTLLSKKHVLETELKNKLDIINKTKTDQQTTGNINVSDKLKILLEEGNLCNILLFLMGRTSFIRGYLTALLLYVNCENIIRKINKTLAKANSLENKLFDYQQKLYRKCQC
jgi:hypothetical protein